MKESYLNYHYQNLMKNSEWLYITPSASTVPTRIITQECGRFYFDQESYTERGSLESYELAFLLSDAHYRLSYKQRIYEFGKAGDVFFIDCRGGYRLDTYGYSDIFFVHFWGEAVEYYHGLFEKFNSNSPVINMSDLPIREKMEKIIRIYRNPSGETADLYAQSVILEILQMLIQATIGEPLSKPYSRHVSFAIKYIKEHYAEPLTIDLVAGEINISRSYLTKVFKQETGLTFSEWLRKWRLSKAKELLKNTDLSQEEICGEVGIYDSSYLCRLFKEFENITPDKYRKHWSVDY